MCVLTDFMHDMPAFACLPAFPHLQLTFKTYLHYYHYHHLHPRQMEEGGTSLLPILLFSLSIYFTALTSHPSSSLPASPPCHWAGSGDGGGGGDSGAGDLPSLPAPCLTPPPPAAALLSLPLILLPLALCTCTHALPHLYHGGQTGRRTEETPLLF